MSQVLVRPADYEYETTRKTFFEIMDSIAGDMISRNDRVLIKPNLLAPSKPEKAIVTHPSVVKAAVEYVLDRGGKPQVSDSPAFGSFRKVFAESGIHSVLKDLDVECREFMSTVRVETGEPLGAIEVAEDAVKTDLVINLPKMKTHSQMLLTLGVKNLFGCIVGVRKPEWHLRMGTNREMFARLLVEIHRVVKPAVTVMDGVMAMEGQGPGASGTPRHIGVLIGSRDTFALDSLVCRMVGIEPEKLLTNLTARELGLSDLKSIPDGKLPEVSGFRLPEMSPLIFGPRFLHGMLRKHLVQRPVCETAKCEQCGRCWTYCPASAIAQRKGKLSFDYDACIRCYCCVEVCPEGALKAREPLAGKFIHWARRKKG